MHRRKAAGDRLVGVIEAARLLQQLLHDHHGVAVERSASAVGPGVRARAATMAAKIRRSSSSRKLSSPMRSITCSKYAGRCSSTRTSSRSAPLGALARHATPLAAPHA